MFAGRQAELEALSHAAVDTWQRSLTKDSSHLSKRTRIIHGAPGAGKSTLLRELARHLHSGSAEPGQPRLLYTNSAEFSQNTDKIIARLENLARLDADSWKGRLKSIASRVSYSANPGPLGASLDADSSALERPRNIGELADRLPADRWQAPVVLAIDEFQNIAGSSRLPDLKETLLVLHEAVNGLPLMLVLAGLGNTPAIAAGVGLTSGLTSTGIGCLEAGEARGLVRGWCRHFGVDPEGYDIQLDQLSGGTDGWPRHLHFALQALAGELVLPGVDGRLSGVRWSVVMERNLELRRNYYNRQQSPEMRMSSYLIAAVMRDLDPDEGLIGVERLIRKHNCNEPGWRLPTGMDVDEFASHLIHQGALQENDKGGVVCPIPSFRSFLVERGEPVPEIERKPSEPEPRPVDKDILNYDDPSDLPSPGGW